MHVLFTSKRTLGHVDSGDRTIWVKETDYSIQLMSFLRILNWFDNVVCSGQTSTITIDLPRFSNNGKDAYNGILYAFSIVQQYGRDASKYEAEYDRLDSNSTFDKYAGLALSAYESYLKNTLPEGHVLDVLSARVTFGKVYDSPMGEFKHISIKLPNGQEPSWKRMQSIKNKLFGDEAFAVQVYPPESKLKDYGEFHLWVSSSFKGESPIGFN